MKTRRQFLKFSVGLLTFAGLIFHPVLRGIRFVYAQAREIILPRGTPRETLIDKNPAHLDTRNLEVTPLEGFGNMGLSDHQVRLDEWRLQVTGHVKTSLNLSYSRLLELPTVERNVLLICPGFFANHGRWKGVSMKALLAKADLKEDATHVTFYGPEGIYEMLQTYPLHEVLSDKVFLAYEVNGTPLPQAHGYPLRIVAEGYYGFDWIKYVYKVNVKRVETPPKSPEEE